MAECLSPSSIVNPKGKSNRDRITIPCGVCFACQANKRAGWTFRLLQELKSSFNAFFVTLTYNDENVPISFDNEDNPVYSLLVRDVQLFMKRLRYFAQGMEHLVDGKKIRYFIVGEYGENTMRPHYHCILFNVPLLMFDCEDSKVDIFQHSWDKGFSYIGSVTQASIHYVTKYVLKNKTFEELNINEGFSLMSRRGGIGCDYLTDEVKEWHNNGYEYRDYVVFENGTKQKLPRYYRDKLFSEIVKENIAIVNNSIVEKKKIAELRDLEKRKGSIGLEEINRKEMYIENIKKRIKREKL